MELAKAFKTLADSDAEDWNRTTVNHGLEVAVYRGDVDLRIETSLEDLHVQNPQFTAPWANNHTDPAARGYFYDLYYRSSLLHRFVLVSVDGARALLPLPRTFNSTDVPLITYRVAQIWDEAHGGTLDQYMQSSGLRVEPTYVSPV